MKLQTVRVHLKSGPDLESRLRALLPARPKPKPASTGSVRVRPAAPARAPDPRA